jgi:hypothetical protein
MAALVFAGVDGVFDAERHPNEKAATTRVVAAHIA